MYRKSVRRNRYEGKVARCAAMRAAKERKRLARPVTPEWESVRVIKSTDPRTGVAHEWKLSSNGITICLEIDGCYYRCASERTIRAILAREMWKCKNKT